MPTSVKKDVRMVCKQRRLKEAMCILQLMDEHADSFAYHSLLQGCLKNRALPDAKLIHAHIIQTAFKFNCNDISLPNKLVSVYAKCGNLVDGRRFLEQMPERNVVSWSIMIAAYSRAGHGSEALIIFNQMRRTSISPNQFTLSSIVPVCTHLAAVEEVHEEIIRSGFQSEVFVGNALLYMYAKCGSIETARYVFDKMPKRDVVSWNAMIAGYAQKGYVNEALELFDKMPERNVVSWTSMIVGYAQNGFIDKAAKLFDEMPERNVVSWTSMISGYAQNGRVDEASKLFRTMPERNLVSWTAMIAGYAQNGLVDEALKLFQEMPLRNVEPWNAMIAGYAQNSRNKEALKLFREMQRQGMKPNSMTFGSVIAACADMAALEQGLQIHEEVIKNGFQSDLFVANALVYLYAKCGSIEVARDVFDKMDHKDVVSWNAMIAGYAMHGFGKEALKLFEQLKHCRTYPDHVTFVGVLSACCHAGLVDEGLQYFNCMSLCYQITPTMEHYACMVDLLGRAGHLDKAQNFINRMPIKPDYILWSSLIAACRIHKNIKLGEFVAERLIELNTQKATPYVALSNIYAAAGRWDGIEKVRKMMEDEGVRKEPGCSSIEVNKQVHTFFVGDRSHPQMQIWKVGNIVPADESSSSLYTGQKIKRKSMTKKFSTCSNKEIYISGMSNKPTKTIIIHLRNVQ